MRKTALISLLVAGCLACITTARAETTLGSGTEVLDWSSFDIAAGESRSFAQPSSDSIILGRIVGNEPTVISGSLSSNGSIFLVNANGFILNPDSDISVNRLYLATDYSVLERYIAGDSIYEGQLQGGDVTLAGDISAFQVSIFSGGSISLLAGGNIRTTDSGGLISLTGGTISLASGATLSIAGADDGQVAPMPDRLISMNYELTKDSELFVLAVPEPKTGLLMLAGLTVLGVAARRRNNRTSTTI